MGNDSGDSHDALLARLDERSKGVKEGLASFIDSASKTYVTKDEFEPVKRIVYGLVSAILLAVLGGSLALVLR